MTHEIFVFLSLLNPLLLIQNMQLCKCEKIYCQEAIGSVKFVESCPTSKAEWDDAARRKDCSRIAAQQNCRTVEYHCVINEYRNDTLEVCAPSKLIFYHCVEFNVAGGVIQEHSSAVCNNEFPKCDVFYKSSTAYKYSDCYKLVQKSYSSAKYATTTKDTTTAITDTFWNAKMIIGILTVMCGTLTMITVAVILVYKHRLKRNAKNAEEVKRLITRDTDLNKNDFSKADMVEEEIIIVLLGRKGSEKISTGNTILGKNYFNASINGPSATLQCSHYHTLRFNHKIVVVNTPDTFDQSASEEIVQKEIRKCILLSSPGPHAFVFVVNSTECTQEEHQFVDYFIKCFGERIYKYFILLYTRKDVETAYDKLMLSVTKVGGRVITFNNRLEGEEKNAQVQKLLTMILENVQSNEGKTYTDEIYKQAETYMKKNELENLNEEQEQKMKEEQNKFDKIYEQKIEEIEKLNQRLEEMKIEIDSGNQFAEIEKKLLSKVTDDKCKLLEEMAEKHTKGKKEIEQKLRDEFESKKKNIRDKSREDVEKEIAFVKNLDWIKRKVPAQDEPVN